MGLDMYAWKTKAEDIRNRDDTEELAYWRKHNRLHGYMEMLWEDKGKPFDYDEDNPMGSNFNCIPLELDEDDLKNLKMTIKEKDLPDTQGFFFGHDSYDYDTEEVKEQREYDLDFVKNGLKAIKDGYKVVYSSWW